MIFLNFTVTKPKHSPTFKSQESQYISHNNVHIKQIRNGNSLMIIINSIIEEETCILYHLKQPISTLRKIQALVSTVLKTENI